MAANQYQTRDGGEGTFNGLAKFYVFFAIVWTALLIIGAVYLFLNRKVQCVRIRNLSLGLSAVSCLHVYWVLCMLAYFMGTSYPCATEYWVMSIYLPLGIALFQAYNMQLLHVAGSQERMLSFTPGIVSAPKITPHSRSLRRYWYQWKNKSLVERTELGIGVGMVVQLIVSTSVFLASRKFHKFGSISNAVSSSQCRRGVEWIPSTIWQLVWAWFFAPYILWRIRNIKDVHYWRIQTTICVVAALPGSPLWLVALYSHSEAWATINEYWLPPLWFTPGIMTMEAVTVFLPCYEVIMNKWRQKRMLGILKDWEDKRGAIAVGGEAETNTATSSYAPTSTAPPSFRSDNSSHRRKAYTRQSLEKCLAEDPSALLHFAASKEFTGENIIFLGYVRDWKAAWDRIQSSEPDYRWDTDPSHYRLRLFKIAVEIYAACVDMNTAEYPINIESQIYLRLRSLFGEAAKYLSRPVSHNSATPFTYSERENHTVVQDVDIESSSYSYDMTHFPSLSRLPSASSSSPIRGPNTSFATDDKQALFHQSSKHDLASARKGIMQIEPRMPDDVFVPADFGPRSFNEAEKSVKYMVFTNTWPRYVDAISRDRGFDSTT